MRPAIWPRAGELPTSTMSDIAFLFVTEPGPGPHPSRLPSEPAIVVEVGTGEHLKVDERATPIDALLEALRPILAENPHRYVVLKPTSGAGYRNMVKVFDLLRQARDLFGLRHHINVSLPTENELLEIWR